MARPRRWSNDPMPAYQFLPVEGENLHQIPVGPVHAGIIEPGHFRFTADGETVVRLEQRLGYVHKGIDALMVAPRCRAPRASPAACRATARSPTPSPSPARWRPRSASTPPPRGGVPARRDGGAGARRQPPRRFRRDLQRCLVQHHAGALRRAAGARAARRRRLLRPSADDGPHCAGRRRRRSRRRRDRGNPRLGRRLRARLPALVELYDDTASLQDRTVGTGIVRPELVRRFGAGGYVGRASGRDFDARRDLAYAPYDTVRFDVPVRQDGDVNARVWIRIREIEQSLSIDRAIAGTNCHPARCGNRVRRRVLRSRRRHGVGRGIPWRRSGLAAHRMRGRIERCHLRDASWFQWPLLEAAIEGNIVADFPLCNKSFNCSYSGHDL